MNKRPDPTPEKLARYDNPVLFSTDGASVWHLPVIDGDTVGFLCSRDQNTDSIRVCEHDFFLRRRNARMCKTCGKRVESNEHSEITVKAND